MVEGMKVKGAWALSTPSLRPPGPTGVDSGNGHGAPMTPMDKTETLVKHLEAALERLEAENYAPLGSCCACLQDVATVGHLPSCHLAGALVEIANWRAGASSPCGGST
jgi:hypothetical protein